MPKGAPFGPRTLPPLSPRGQEPRPAGAGGEGLLDSLTEAQGVWTFAEDGLFQDRRREHFSPPARPPPPDAFVRGSLLRSSSRFGVRAERQIEERRGLRLLGWLEV